MSVRTAKLITGILAGVCGFLLLTAILQYAGVGRGYRWAPDPDADAASESVGRIDRKPVQLPPESAFAEISRHPLFNVDREPTPVDATAEAGAEENVPASPLNVALTGVIIDEPSDVRVAMLQDKARNQPITLRVGMPLEGDQAGWTLVEVKPRSVVFRSVADETTEVELETATAPPPAARPAGPAARVNARPAARDPAQANQDLARRIEERRRKMREDAERLRNQQQPASPKK